MADVAGIRNFLGVSFRRADETEGVAAHIHVAEGLRDFRHVTGDTLAACAVCLVMRVLLQRRRVRAAGRLRAVADEAQLLCGFSQAGGVPSHNPRWGFTPYLPHWFRAIKPQQRNDHET